MQYEVSKKNIWTTVKNSSVFSAVVAFVIVIIVMSIASPTFLTASNLTNLISQGAVLAVVTIGQTFVIITGGIDLSVAPLISLSTVLTASMIAQYNLPWGVAALIAVIACIACGLINGILITFVKIPPIIATLSTSMAYQELCLLYSQGYGINLPAGNSMTELLSYERWLGIPVAGFIVLALYIIFYVVLKYTKTGRVTYGLGGSKEAVYLSGIRSNIYSIKVYIISGLLSGIAGVLLTARLNSGHPYNGDGFDMDSIAASVLGGVSVAGGIGNIWGSLIGVFTLTIITNGLNMINLNTYVQMMIKGLIIVAAIGIGGIRQNKNK